MFSPTTVVSNRCLLIISNVLVNLIVFAQSHLNLREDARIFVTMNALLFFINEFVFLLRLSTNLLLVPLMFFLSHLGMLVAAVTVVLGILLILRTIFLFFLLFPPIVPLLLSALVIDCRQVAGWLRQPNVCFLFCHRRKERNGSTPSLLDPTPTEGYMHKDHACIPNSCSHFRE